MKTKNAPKDLKCKINHTFFLETGVPKRGGGGTVGQDGDELICENARKTRQNQAIAA